MKSKLNTYVPEENQFETEVFKRGFMDDLLMMVKPQGFKPPVYINPPPEDMCCEICGLKADDLEPFDQWFCEANEQYEKAIKELYPNSPCILKYISPDHKLFKIFRAFYFDQVEASWECKDCFELSDIEASDICNKSNMSTLSKYKPGL